MACQLMMRTKKDLNFLLNLRMGDQEYLGEMRGQLHIQFQLLEVLEVKGHKNINK